MLPSEPGWWSWRRSDLDEWDALEIRLRLYGLTRRRGLQAWLYAYAQWRNIETIGGEWGRRLEPGPCKEEETKH